MLILPFGLWQNIDISSRNHIDKYLKLLFVYLFKAIGIVIRQSKATHIGAKVYYEIVI